MGQFPLTTTGARRLTTALLIWMLAMPALALASGPTPSETSQISALVESVPSPPRWFTGSDGLVHLAYELWLTNPLPVPVTVTQVDVLNDQSGTTLMHLDGTALLAAMSLAAQPDVPSVLLPPSTIGIIWFDVPLANESAVPVSIAHRIKVELPPGTPVAELLLSFTAPSVAVDLRPPVVLGAPLAGSGWAALGSCCDGPHRRAIYPIDGDWFLAQRFAIDFNKLDAENRPGAGDPRLYTSFPTYGQPVLAVADATVIEAVDRFPDLQVGEAREDLTVQNAGGNHIVLDLGDGRYAIYAHLQEGSVAVQAGDQVKRGQVIARVGSSGTSGGPHLHFQVTDRPSVVAADGMPYVFDQFELTGHTPPLEDVLPYYDTLEPIPITTDGAGPRRDALPLGNDVVTFPEAASGGS